MGRDEGMRIVGTIRSIELCSLTSKFEGVPTRQVAKVQIDVERALDEDGGELPVENLSALAFQGPPELVPRFSAGERVQITTTAPSGMHIASIRPAPLS